MKGTRARDAEHPVLDRTPIAVAVLHVLIATAACGPAETAESLSSRGNVTDGEPAAAPMDEHAGAPGSGSTAAARHAAYLAAVQGRAPAEYRLELTPSGGARGLNPAHRLRFELDVGGVLLLQRDEPGAPWLQLAWASVGRGDRRELVPLCKGGVEIAGNRVALRHGEGLEQWYLNGPLGLEQGFVLSEPPTRGRDNPSEPLTLAIEIVGDVEPVLLPSGRTLELRIAGQPRPIRYSSLHVTDSTDRELPSWMDLRGRTLRLHIDDQDAEYPLLIDPVYEAETKLLAADGTNGDFFGQSVSMSGDLALVGAPGEGAPGAAYVYARSAATWSEEDKLTPSPGASGDYFGHSVSLSGEVALVGAPHFSVDLGRA